MKKNEVVVAGTTSGAFAGQTNFGNDDAFVQAIGSAGGGTRWTIGFGPLAWDSVGWALGSAGHVFVIGDTAGTFPDQVSAGGVDTYLARIDIGSGGQR